MIRGLTNFGFGALLAYGIKDKSFDSFKQHMISPFYNKWNTESDYLPAIVYLFDSLPSIFSDIWNNRADKEELNAQVKHVSDIIKKDIESTVDYVKGNDKQSNKTIDNNTNNKQSNKTVDDSHNNNKNNNDGKKDK